MANKFHLVRVRGIPFTSTETDVKEFFGKCSIKAVHFILNTEGRPSGDSYIELTSLRDMEEAMKLDQAYMGWRYLEVFKAHSASELRKWRKRMQDKESVQYKCPPLGPVSSRLSDRVDDCYFYQLEKCTRGKNCPFLHRTFPDEVCNRFLFKRCKQKKTCLKKHLSALCLPPPSAEEADRVRTLMQGRRKRDAVFECLDCEVTTTSYFQLESHCDSKKHLDRVEQIRMEGRKGSGLVGDVENKWTSQDEAAWAAARQKAIIEDEKDHIHVSNIPANMNLITFKLICRQFGEITALKMLKMSEKDAQHAYVRYATKKIREFAAIKLKKLQKSRFEGAMESLAENLTPLDCHDESDQNGSIKEECVRNQQHEEISDALEQVALDRENLEYKLLLCQTQMKICVLNGEKPAKTLKLLQEEIKIQREIRYAEVAEQKIEKSSFKNRRSSLSSVGRDPLLFLTSEVFNSDDDENLSKFKTLALPQLKKEDMSHSVKTRDAFDVLLECNTDENIIETTKAVIKRRIS